ncbi:hypothetical protein MMC19_000075 [Ptychographa xylographoides]|nr:hypothetical protein [Ptychographa xylographoides]
MSGKSLKRPAEDSQDSDPGSEWEYEYHQTETESFFVTLDLSSAPPTRVQKKRKARGPAAENPPVADASDDASTQAPAREIDTLDTAANPSSSPDPESRVQILDLHTSNPVVSYNNHIFSCQWTSTLGTDILLTPPDPTPPTVPLYKAPGFHILGIANTKLIGNAVQIVPRLDSRASPDKREQPPFMISSDNAAALSETRSSLSQTTTSRPEDATRANEHGPRPTPNLYGVTSVPQTTSESSTFPPSIDEAAPSSQNTIGSVRLPLPNTAPRTRQYQASFLERLVATKRSKSEKDSVTLHTKRQNTGSGWRSWVGKSPYRAQVVAESQDNRMMQDEGRGEDMEGVEDDTDDTGIAHHHS